MQLSKRTRISLSQILSVVEKKTTNVLLDKYGLDTTYAFSILEVKELIESATEDQVSDLIIEIVNTKKTLRNTTQPKYEFDEYFEEFRKSFLLDGYVIEEKSISALDPNIQGQELVGDALLSELESSGLDNDEAIKRCINQSASDFIKATPDYNGSLTNFRVALETIIRKIAVIKGFSSASTSGNTWGPSLSYLRNNMFITTQEEKALASVFTFISNGAHIPVGFSEEEFVRLGRNICSSMCYFVIKQYNA